MNFFVRRPIFIAVVLFLVLVIASLLISIPIVDADVIYNHKMVHFTVKQSVSLRNLLGIETKDLMKNGLLPTGIDIKPIGYAMLVLFYIGFPILLFLRFRFAAKKNELENGEENAH